MKAIPKSMLAASLSIAGTGAAMMFFLDPDRGRRRRALVHDKAQRLSRETSRFFGKAARDLRHRTWGVAAETRSRLSSSNSDDMVLAERVRSKLGRIVSHPSAIHVLVRDGVVTLSGDVLQSEMRDLLNAVSSIRGVRDIRNELSGHANDTKFSGLQGESSRRSDAKFRPAPGTRVLLAAAGGALAVYGARLGGVRGKLLEAVGAGLLGTELSSSGFHPLARKLAA